MRRFLARYLLDLGDQLWNATHTCARHLDIEASREWLLEAAGRYQANREALANREELDAQSTKVRWITPTEAAREDAPR